jgi:hypothetical protein
VQTAVLDVEQAHVVRSAVGVGRGRVAAPVVAAIGDEPGRARLPHFSERDLLLALYRSAYSTGPGQDAHNKQAGRDRGSRRDQCRVRFPPIRHEAHPSEAEQNHGPLLMARERAMTIHSVEKRRLGYGELRIVDCMGRDQIGTARYPGH